MYRKNKGSDNKWENKTEALISRTNFIVASAGIRV
jgi:hypothetical protein